MLYNILGILDKYNKRRYAILLIEIIIGSFFELLGTALILPYVSVVMDMDSLKNNEIFRLIVEKLKLSSQKEIIITMSLVLIVVYIAKNLYLVFLYNDINHVTYKYQMDMSARTLDSLMKKNYEFFVNTNSAEMVRNIVDDVSGLYECIKMMLWLIANSLMSLLLIIYLFTVDVAITVSVLVLLSLFVGIFVIGFRNKLREYGDQNLSIRKDLIQWVNQAAGSIKEIKILKNEEYFKKKFRNRSAQYATVMEKYNLISLIPQYALEILLVGIIVTVVVIGLISNGNMLLFFPKLSAFVMVAYKLMPAANKINGYIANIFYYKPAISAVYNRVMSTESDGDVDTREKMSDDCIAVKLQGIHFAYQDAREEVLSDVNLEVRYGESLAITGASGAGKTTLADIILGILKPTKGNVYIGFDSDSKKIGYVPQTTYLLDDTIESNIALGVDEDEVDRDKIFEVLKRVDLYDHIIGLPDGLKTIVGEQGFKLSGGQRQRLGIARALYFNPQIVVFDEATSALDNNTEDTIIEAIDSLKGKITLLIIAHRLRTIKNCDRVIEVINGNVLEKGTM